MGTLVRAGARTLATALARTAAVLAGGTLAAALGIGSQDVLLAVRPARAGTHLRIDGSVAGLAPGAPARPLVLTLRNPGDEPARVTRVSATTTGTSHDGCDGGYLDVGTWRGAVTVPAGGHARVELPVRLSATTPAACAAVAWGLVYTAS